MAELHKEELALRDRERELTQESAMHQRGQTEKFELLKSLKYIAHLPNQHQNGLNPAKIREIIKQASSNLVVCQKTLTVQWIPAISVLLEPVSPYVVRQLD